MIDLADAGAVKAADPGGMLADVLDSAGQFERARASAVGMRKDLPTRAERIVYLGMGGSGIAGDALVALAADTSPAPIVVVKDYTLPAFAQGPETLVIACSYSGNTEETLSGFEQARRRGCQTVGITSGGELAKLCADHGFPIIEVPTGIQPRAAFPSLLAATLTIAETAGALKDISEEVAAAVAAMEQTAADGHPEGGGGLPGQLAERMHGKHVHIWGMADLAGVVASRWKNQIQENAKAPASNASLPELDHNEIMSYDPGEATLQQTLLVILRHDGEHPRVALRVEITRELIAGRNADEIMVRSHAPGDLATLMDLVLTGDLASVYLAFLRGIDPSPVPAIESLKRRLADA